MPTSGVRFKGKDGGFGATVRSAVEVEGGAKLRTEALHGASGPAVNAALALERSGPGDIGFELPLEVRAGVWRRLDFAPRYLIEADVVWQQWSATGNRVPSLASCRLGCEATQDRDWIDTLAIRVGVETNAREHLDLYGGLAFEPSPLISRTFEPGFPRGDAYVLGIGMGYEITSARMRLDLGYSFHQYVDTDSATGTYSSRDQVFSFSIRRDF